MGRTTENPSCPAGAAAGREEAHEQRIPPGIAAAQESQAAHQTATVTPTTTSSLSGRKAGCRVAQVMTIGGGSAGRVEAEQGRATESVLLLPSPPSQAQ